ncbi:MAG: hypothetical protein AAFW47_06695 [Pseudomonadota bacterium]
MPDYLTDKQIWIALWPIFLLPFVITVCLTYISSGLFEERNARFRFFLVVFAFSLLGVTTGQITGMSRVSAVGAVLPAVLSLFGGVLIYLVGTKGPNTQAFLGVATIGLVTNLLVGVFWGSKSRVTYEHAVASPERLLIRALALEDNRHTIALRQLLNNAEIADFHKRLEERDGTDISMPDVKVTVD